MLRRDFDLRGFRRRRRRRLQCEQSRRALLEPVVRNRRRSLWRRNRALCTRKTLKELLQTRIIIQIPTVYHTVVAGNEFCPVLYSTVLLEGAALRERAERSENSRTGKRTCDELHVEANVEVAGVHGGPDEPVVIAVVLRDAEEQTAAVARLQLDAIAPLASPVHDELCARAATFPLCAECTSVQRAFESSVTSCESECTVQYSTAGEGAGPGHTRQSATPSLMRRYESGKRRLSKRRTPRSPPLLCTRKRALAAPAAVTGDSWRLRASSSHTVSARRSPPPSTSPLTSDTTLPACSAPCELRYAYVTDW